MVFTVKLKVKRQLEADAERVEEEEKDRMRQILGMLGSAAAETRKKDGTDAEHVVTAPILRLTVVRAADLSSMDVVTGKSDPYVVLAVGDEERRTSVKARTLAPEWEEAFDFRLSDAKGQVATAEVITLI